MLIPQQAILKNTEVTVLDVLLSCVRLLSGLQEAWQTIQDARKVMIANITVSSQNYAGGAGQKSAFPKIKEDLWDAAQEQVSMDMPESHEKAERGQMAEDGLAGASPEDQTAFPSNVEDQVPLADPSLALTASQSLQSTLPQHQRLSRDCLTYSLFLCAWRSVRWSCYLGDGWCR